MKEIRVKKYEKHLSDYLIGEFPLLTYGKLNKYLRENKIKVNGKKVPLDTSLESGDIIALYLSDDLLSVPTEDTAYTFAKADIDIIYEDDDLLVVNKPSGIPVVDDDWRVYDTLINRIKKHYDGTGISPTLCHRLDTGTSGIVICGKTKRFTEFALDLFRNRDLDKEYVCLVRGRPERQGVYKAHLTKNSRRGYVTVSESPSSLSKPIETRISTIRTIGDYSLLKVGLITGRTHQIRAHLSFLGMPILGDSRYGINSLNRRYNLKYQCLCCRIVTFGIIDDERYSYLSDRSFVAEDPWFVEKFNNGEFK